MGGPARFRPLLAGAALAAAVALPLLASGYQLFLASQALIFVVALAGLNLLTGLSGQISLGHGAFFGLGGYVAAILTSRYGWPYGLAIPGAAAAGCLAGLLFGLPALRLSGLHLALATFGLALALPQALASRTLAGWTGGAQGLQLTRPPAPFGWPLTRDQWAYLLCLAFAAAALVLLRNLRRARVGRALAAIRDHAVAAEAMGVNVALYKATCFGVSAMLAALAGSLSALNVGYVAPESFGLTLSLTLLVGVVVGGLGSVGGVVFGALFVEFLPLLADRLALGLGESARALPGAVYGLLLIGAMLLAPSGVAGLWRRARGGGALHSRDAASDLGAKGRTP